MDPETLTYDEWDALLIEEWVQADPGAPVPASSREGEFEWAHQNQVAWLLVDESNLGGKSKAEVEQLMRMVATDEERKFDPNQPRGPHTGKWIDVDSSVIDALTKSPAHGEGWTQQSVSEHTIVYEKNFQTFIVQDPSVSEQQIKRLLVLADRLKADNPLPAGEYLVAHVITRAEMNRLHPPRVDPANSTRTTFQTDGFNVLGTGSITMSGDTITSGVQDSHGFNTPVGDTVSRGEYVFTHEWGHGLDTRTSAERVIDEKGHPAKGSKYGGKNEAERYAESFAEFYLSAGKTPLLSPREDAEEYGWKVTPP